MNKPTPLYTLTSKVKIKGFTLIEMLVVMVILALTTTLLTQGLSSTWRNFERLGARNLISSSGHLPLSWFERSLAGAVLYHPDKVLVKGSSQEFQFTTFMAPDDPEHLPQVLTWSITSAHQQRVNQWALSFQSQRAQQPQIVHRFTTQPYFEYWSGQKWLKDFVPNDSRLPLAVRIILDEQVWGVAKITRPAKADTPVEMPLFGV